MRNVPYLITATAIAVVAIIAFTAAPARSQGDDTLAKQTERGRNFVHHVGMCTDCHSPRNERGEFIEDKHLSGAPIGFAPIVPMPAWAPAAPPIAGLPSGYTEQDVVRFLMTGVRPHGLPPPRPPMPAYRLSEEDATAVAAYLRSLASHTN